MYDAISSANQCLRTHVIQRNPLTAGEVFITLPLSDYFLRRILPYSPLTDYLLRGTLPYSPLSGYLMRCTLPQSPLSDRLPDVLWLIDVVNQVNMKHGIACGFKVG